MADSDVSLSMDIDVTDAKKTAEQLQKEIEQIFSQRGNKESQTLKGIESGIRNSVDEAIRLRKEMDGLATDIANTENYAKFQQQIEQEQNALTALSDSMQQARESASRMTQAPLTVRGVTDLEAEIALTEKAIKDSQQYGYSTDTLEKKLQLLTNYQQSYNEKLAATSVSYQGQMMTYTQLDELYSKTQENIQRLQEAQAGLKVTNSDMSSSQAAAFANGLRQQYDNLDTSLQRTNAQMNQQLIVYTTTAEREEALLQLQRQRGALEERSEERRVGKEC